MHTTPEQTVAPRNFPLCNRRARLALAGALALFLAAGTGGGLAQSCVAPPAGLLAWWAGDGNYLNSAAPFALVPHGGVGFAAGKCGSAFDVDGSGSDLQWLAPATLPVGNQPRTLALWFRTPLNLTSATEAALIQYGSEGYSQMFGLITSVNAPGKLYFFGYNADVAGTTTLLPNTWYFGAVTFDGSTVALYVNGHLENSLYAPGLNTQLNANGLTVGYRPYGTRWTGQLDEVSIWNRALTAAEVAAIYTAGAAGMCKSGLPALPVTQGLRLWLDADYVTAGGVPADGAAVTTWHDRGTLGLDVSAPAPSAPVYRAGALNGHGGIDFSGSTADYLASAYTSAFGFTNCSIVMVGNHAEHPAHVSIAAPLITQEFLLYDKSLIHESAPYHWGLRSHQDAPASYYIQAGLFGASSNHLINVIGGIESTQAMQYSWDVGQQFGVQDYVPTDRQLMLGWRNSNSDGGPALAGENFNGVLCEVLVYDHLLTASELNQVSHYLEGKYALPWARPPLRLQPLNAGAGSTAVAWPADAGLTYQLQTCTSLSAADWVDAGSSLTATGSSLAATNAVGAEAHRFYRVRVLP